MAVAALTGAGNVTTTATTTATASSVVLGKPSNTADGDLLVAFVYFRNSGGTVTAPSGWTQLGPLNTTNETFAAYSRPIPSAAAESATTYTWSTSGGSSRANGILFRVTGADLSATPASGALAAYTGTSSVSLPAVTTGTASNLLLGFAINNTSTATQSVMSSASMTTVAEVVSTSSASPTATADIWVGAEQLSASGSTGTRSITMSPAAGNSGGFMVALQPVLVVSPSSLATGASVPSPSITSSSTGAAALTLTDQFSSFDASKWSAVKGSGVVTGGVLTVTPLGDYSDSTTSVSPYSLVGSQASIELVARQGQGGGTTEFVYRLMPNLADSAQQVGFIISGGNLLPYKTVGGARTVLTTIAYSATNHRFLRLRESAGTVSFDASATGSAWTALATWAAEFPLTRVFVEFNAGYYGAETSPSAALVDNFNVQPLLPTSIASAAVVPSPVVAVVPGAQTLSPASIATAAAVPGPTLGTVITLSPDGIATGEAVPNPALTRGSVISPDSILSDAVVPGVTVSANQTVRYTFIPPNFVRRVPLSGALIAEILFSRAILRIDGEFVETEFPSEAQVNAADLYYEGGHIHTIDSSAAAVLTAAGYEVSTSYE